MTWAWVGVAGMVALFVLVCIVIVALLAVLWTLIFYTVTTIREGLRTDEPRQAETSLHPAAVERRARVTPIIRNPE